MSILQGKNARLSNINNGLEVFVKTLTLHDYFIYRSAPQVANLGGHPVQPPFKIPEIIIY